MNAEQTIAANGTVVYWQLSDMDVKEINRRLAALGYDREVTCRTDRAALKAAIRSALGTGGKADRLILGLENKGAGESPGDKGHGYEVRTVERGDDENEVRHDFSVRVVRADDGRARPELLRGNLPVQLWELGMLFDNAKGVATAGAVAEVLTAIIQRELDGVLLRAHGGVYWVPEARRLQLENLAEAIREAGLVHVDGRQQPASTVYRVRTAIDEGTVAAVKDAIMNEVNAAAEEIREQLATNELGKFALKTRQDAANRLRHRVTRYEAMLGEAMTTLHQTLKDVDTELRAAGAMEVYVGLFD